MLTLQEIEAVREKSEEIPSGDAVYARMKLPFKARFYPLGFPVDIMTNSKEVIEAAVESWGSCNELFRAQPIELQVVVLEGSSHDCPPAPVVRVRQHLFSFAADGENYGIGDLRKGFSTLWLTTEAVKHRHYLRYFFLDCAAISQISARYVTGVHSGCVTRNGVGVLLCGDSGAGKSTLTYACARAGWTYVTDDGSYMVHGRDDLLIVGNCYQLRFRPSVSSLFPEISGREVTRHAEVGKPSIEIEPAKLPDIQWTPTTNAHYLVLINRREDTNRPLAPYPKETVRQFLRQNRFAPSDLLLRHHAAIDRLLEQPVLELCYRDLDWAIEQLNQLAETGRP